MAAPAERLKAMRKRRRREGLRWIESVSEFDADDPRTDDEAR